MIVHNRCTILQDVDAAFTPGAVWTMTTSGWQARHEQPRAPAGGDELVERLARVIHEDGIAEPLEGVRLRRASSPTELGHGVSFPALCVVAQGSKEVLLGDDLYRYDPAHYLVTTAALPIATRITEASEERPYLGLVLRLDTAMVGSVMVEAGHSPPRDHTAMRAFHVSPLDAALLDAVIRLAGLLDSRADVPFLAPMVKREIVYRLLTGQQGARLRHLAPRGARPTASSGPSSGSARTSTGRFESRTSRVTPA